MPTYKLVSEDGVWLTDGRLNGFDWRAGDRIHRGPGDTLEVVEVSDPDAELSHLAAHGGEHLMLTLAEDDAVAASPKSLDDRAEDLDLSLP
jgi:hypothetical protein